MCALFLHKVTYPILHYKLNHATIKYHKTDKAVGRDRFQLCPDLSRSRLHPVYNNSMKNHEHASGREHYGVYELKYPWLAILLDAYKVVDEGVSADMERHEAKSGKPHACQKGCAGCCSLKDIPVYPLELNGIYWYAVELLNSPVREAVIDQLRTAVDPKAPCPFLVDSACSIYPLRPAACRQFNVFGRACTQGEDPFFTRRSDVLTPSEDWRLRAFGITLPFYGMKVKGEIQIMMAADEIIQSKALNLKSHKWARLAELMAG